MLEFMTLRNLRLTVAPGFRLCLAAAFAVYAVPGQPPAVPAFEVASVKLAAPLDFQAMMAGKAGPGVKIDAGRVSVSGLSIRDVIVAAYRLKPFQLSGPDWMKTTMVDIVATLPAGTAEDRIPDMLQTLLAERFGLKTHAETKDSPVYALVVGKGGPHLKEAVPDPEAPPVPLPGGMDFGMASRMSNSKMSGDPTKGMVMTGLPQGGTMRMSMSDAGIHMETSSMNMAALAGDLTQYLDRPVVDKTGLTGNYQVAMDMSMDDMRNFMSKSSFPGGGGPPGGGGFGPQGNPAGASGVGDSSGSSVLASVLHLGLKLEPQKAPIAFIVIDHLEKVPIEN